jgi:hypothetical protein
MKISKLPAERIVTTDWLLTAFNRAPDRILEDMDVLDRIVDLACGHKLRTSSIKRAHCPRCQEMFRRSCEDGSEDWDSFRKGLKKDEMEWPADPMRLIHESRYALEMAEKAGV